MTEYKVTKDNELVLVSMINIIARRNELSEFFSSNKYPNKFYVYEDVHTELKEILRYGWYTVNQQIELNDYISYFEKPIKKEIKRWQKTLQSN